MFIKLCGSPTLQPEKFVKLIKTKYTLCSSTQIIHFLLISEQFCTLYSVLSLR